MIEIIGVRDATIDEITFWENKQKEIKEKDDTNPHILSISIEEKYPRNKW